MTGKKKSATPTSIRKWQARLAVLQRARYPHTKAGMVDTVWDDEIDHLEKLISGEEVESVEEDGA